MKSNNVLLTLIFAAVTLTVNAQTAAPAPPKYDQHKVFKPLFYPERATDYRTAGGAPGVKYWQNRADYKVDVTLDTAKNRVSGSVLITYTNNSPDALPFLFSAIPFAIMPLTGSSINVPATCEANTIMVSNAF